MHFTQQILERHISLYKAIVQTMARAAAVNRFIVELTACELVKIPSNSKRCAAACQRTAISKIRVKMRRLHDCSNRWLLYVRHLLHSLAQIGLNGSKKERDAY